MIGLSPGRPGPSPTGPAGPGPSGPAGPNGPQPSGPPPPAPPSGDLFSLAASLGEDVAIDSGRGAAGELSSRPVRSAHSTGVGEEPTPGSAVVFCGATCGSTGVSGAGAAFPSGNDRAGALTPRPGAVSGFVLPDTRVPLRFGEGRDRLVGCVEMGDGPVRPGHPGPPPPPDPTPFPPPVSA